MEHEEYEDIFTEIIKDKIGDVLSTLDELQHIQILDHRERILGQLSVLTSVAHVVLSKMYEAGVDKVVNEEGDKAWDDIKFMLHSIVDNDQEAIDDLQAKKKIRAIHDQHKRESD